MSFEQLCSDFRVTSEEREQLIYRLAWLRAQTIAAEMLGSEPDIKKLLQAILL